MESSGGSSFIPQHPTSGRVAAKSFRKIYVLSYVSYLIFFTTLIAAAGVFFYELSLNSKVTDLQSRLVKERSSFSNADLERVKNLDTRIDAATRLVNNHVALTTIFSALEKVVAQPVKLDAFSYTRADGTNEPTVSVSAAAASFNQVLFQKDVFNNDPITNPLTIESISYKSEDAVGGAPALATGDKVSVVFTTGIPVAAINFDGGIGSVKPQTQTQTVPEAVVEDTATVDGAADGNNTEVNSNDVNQ